MKASQGLAPLATVCRRSAAENRDCPCHAAAAGGVGRGGGVAGRAKK
jgi:hypothetical protein